MNSFDIPGNMKVTSLFTYTLLSSCTVSQFATKLEIPTNSPDRFTWVRLTNESTPIDIKFLSEDSRHKGFHLNDIYVDCEDEGKVRQEAEDSDKKIKTVVNWNRSCHSDPGCKSGSIALG